MQIDQYLRFRFAVFGYFKNPGFKNLAKFGSNLEV
jgi:hypothetical protein